MQPAALLAHTPNPTDAQIDAAMAGNPPLPCFMEISHGIGKRLHSRRSRRNPRVARD
jgi:hypothetical protein